MEASTYIKKMDRKHKWKRVKHWQCSSTPSREEKLSLEYSDFWSFLRLFVFHVIRTSRLLRQSFQVASLGGMLNEFYDYTDFSYFWWLNPFLECDYLLDTRRKYSLFLLLGKKENWFLRWWSDLCLDRSGLTLTIVHIESLTFRLLWCLRKCWASE